MSSLLIDNMDFTVSKLGVFQRLHLDTKLVRMLAPIVKGMLSGVNAEQVKAMFSSKDGEEQEKEESSWLEILALMDRDKVMDGLMEALGSLSDKERESFVGTLLSCVQVSIPGKPPMEFSDPKAMELVFGESLMTLYKVLYFVMQENKLSPFVLIQAGLDAKGTVTSEEDSANES